MVVVGDFKVELVDAHTKEPFKEHSKDGETYVEVEPGVEYYVSIQRIRMMMGGCIGSCMVDGKSLGWKAVYFATNNKPIYYGSMNSEYEGNVERSERVALKFANPTIVIDNQAGPMLMGNVKFQLYKMGPKVPSQTAAGSYTSEMARLEGPALVAAAAGSHKKHVMSSVGETSEMECHTVPKYSYLRGPLLQTITLHYCTVPGLFHAGILAMPSNMYDRHAMIARNNDRPIPPLLVQPQRVSRELRLSQNGSGDADEVTYYDMFDLTTLNDSDNDISIDDTVVQ